jgi:pimeloyl-ACP methyl ester carboxylesterase
MLKKFLGRPACVILTATLAACASSNHSEQARPLAAAMCTDIGRSFSMSGVRVTAARVVPEAAATATQVAIPEHCEVLGAADERIASDGQRYAIKFRLRAPLGDRWSGRMLFVGGGGSNGNLGDGLTAPGAATAPLARGYAVLTQDSGHDNAVNSDPTRTGTRVFSLDFQARVDNGYRSYDRTTGIAKRLIQALYGAPPKRSYFAGCSEGGREALMLTQRFPEHFDGVIAGAPLLEAPKAALVRPVFITQVYADLARKQGLVDRNGLPFINRSLTDDDLAVLARGIANSCDALDGVVDGISQDFKACTAAFNPMRLACSPGQTTDCLSADKAAAIQKQMNGILGDIAWHYDMGAVPGQFRSWWIGPANAVQSSTVMVNGGAPTTTLTPPPAIDMVINNGSEPYRAMLNFDIVKDIGGIYATTPQFPESIWSMMMATSTDVSGYVDRGGKIMMFHGVSDGAFSINQTISYLDQLNAARGGTASSFARLYAVPGMGHCSGGPSTSSFEMLAALEQWVEAGVAPSSILATAPTGTPWPGRTRPLCPYPSVARYKGTGSIEDAANFLCATP